MVAAGVSEEAGVSFLVPGLAASPLPMSGCAFGCKEPGARSRTAGAFSAAGVVPHPGGKLPVSVEVISVS